MQFNCDECVPAAQIILLLNNRNHFFQNFDRWIESLILKTCETSYDLTKYSTRQRRKIR
jgi:hypothetical protein